jgi:hypothetical protein
VTKQPARNDLESAVPKFCLGLEMHRRTPDGRVRTAREFLVHFFPYDKKSSTDRLFKHLPLDVRGPILTTWGVRGRKSALLDDDAKVQSVVHDSLVAGDVDSSMFEDGLPADTIMRWIDLSDWWTFWRGGRITKYTILKALESAHELGLFDAEWFLASIRGGGGALRGTDVLAEGLNKADLTEWVRRVHESGDGSPNGILASLGWDQIVAKTSDEVLIAALDAMAIKVSLAPEAKEPETIKPETQAEAAKKGSLTPPRPAENVAPAPSPALADVGHAPVAAAKTEGASEPKTAEPAKPAHLEAKVEPKEELKVEAKIEAKPEAKVEAKPEAKVEPKPEAPAKIEAKHEAKAEPPLEPKVEAIPKAPALPGVLIPGRPAVPPRAEEKPPAMAASSELIDMSSGEDSGSFKDDELIPISGAWTDEVEAPTSTGGAKPPKRPTRNPPPPPPTRGTK